MIWGGRGAFQRIQRISPPGFKHFVIVKYFTAEGLKPHLVRASARACPNSICSRDWPWPHDFPVSTSPVLGFLGFTVSPAVCGAGDRTQGSKQALFQLSYTQNLTLLNFLRTKKIITCFNIYLKLTKKYKVILNLEYLGSSKRQMDMAPTWNNCSLLSFSPHTVASPTWLVEEFFSFLQSYVRSVLGPPTTDWKWTFFYIYVIYKYVIYKHVIYKYFWGLNPGPLSYTQA